MSGPERFEQQHDAELAAFEQQLMRAMKRTEAPASLADTVLARAQANEQPPARVLEMKSRWKLPQTWAVGAIAAALLVALGIPSYRQHEERVEATRQFEVATQIEQQALERTRQQLSRAGISLDQ